MTCADSIILKLSTKISGMDKTIYVCTVLAVMTSMTVDSANILAIFPTASYSHQMPLLGVARALADRGHNLTVITTNPLKVS